MKLHVSYCATLKESLIRFLPSYGKDDDDVKSKHTIYLEFRLIFRRYGNLFFYVVGNVRQKTISKRMAMKETSTLLKKRVSLYFQDLF